MVSGGFKALFHGFFDNRRERPALRMFAQSVIDHGLIAAAGRLRTRLEGGQYVGVDAHGDARLAAVRGLYSGQRGDLRNRFCMTEVVFLTHSIFPHVWWLDRKSTRLNSSHQIISYAVFCL